jgi:hypothetical protein
MQGYVVRLGLAITRATTQISEIRPTRGNSHPGRWRFAAGLRATGALAWLAKPRVGDLFTAFHSLF